MYVMCSAGYGSGSYKIQVMQVCTGCFRARQVWFPPVLGVGLTSFMGLHGVFQSKMGVISPVPGLGLNVWVFTKCFRVRQAWLSWVQGLGLGLTSLMGMHGVFQSKTDMISSSTGSGSYKSLVCTGCFRARQAWFPPVLGLGLTSFMGLHRVFQSKTGVISSSTGSGPYTSGSAQSVSEQDRHDFLRYWVWVWVLQVWVCMGCFRARQAWFPLLLGMGLGLTSLLCLHRVFQSKMGVISSIAGYGSGSYKSGPAWGVSEQDRCDFFQWWLEAGPSRTGIQVQYEDKADHT